MGQQRQQLSPEFKAAQYTAGEFRAACRTLGITQSMRTVGNSYGNAVAGSFFSGFKREVIDGEHFATRADARQEIFTNLTWPAANAAIPGRCQPFTGLGRLTDRSRPHGPTDKTVRGRVAVQTDSELLGRVPAWLLRQEGGP